MNESLSPLIHIPLKAENDPNRAEPFRSAQYRAKSLGLAWFRSVWTVDRFPLPSHAGSGPLWFGPDPKTLAITVLIGFLYGLAHPKLDGSGWFNEPWILAYETLATSIVVFNPTNHQILFIIKLL